MNILFLTNHLNVGGISSYVLSLARGLKERGHKVYVASSGGDTITRFTEEGIIYIHIPIRTKSEMNIFKIGLSFLRLIPPIRQNQIDIIHSNSRVTQVLGSIIARHTAKPHVTTWHGFFNKKLSRKVFPFWPKRIIAISESVQEHLIQDFCAPDKDIRLVYNGIDLEKLKLRNFKNREELKLNLGLNSGPVVGIIARLSDVKGHLFLIGAMKLVLSKIPDAQLVIIGEGKMEKKLKKLTQDLKIEKNVFFFPKIADIAEALYIMDVFVMPSLKEGLGLGLMEAMAWGRAVIGSEVGGIKNLIQNGHNGLLVRPSDSVGLSQAILNLLEDPVKALELGNNARVFISDNFSLERMVSETEKVYQECLNEKN